MHILTCPNLVEFDVKKKKKTISKMIKKLALSKIE